MKIIKPEPVQIAQFEYGGFDVRFKVGPQLFIFRPRFETKEDAEWFARQFQLALDAHCEARTTTS